MSPNLVPPEGLADAAAQYIKNIHAAYPDSEDCLNLDIIRPAGTSKDVKLPVVVWFYGGGFQSCGISSNNGAPVVARSVAVGTPVVFVAMNYRLNAFGFLAGKEVKAAGVGNLGLRDQRQALRWVQKYIAAFGGDPTKVTLWGQSAGGISIGSQIVANQGHDEGLFRGAIMQSSSPQIALGISTGQQQYDKLVSDMGVCKMSPGVFSYKGLSLTWPITVDDDLLTDAPLRLVQKGKVVRVPVILGSVDDEGTLFALAVTNVTTDAQAREYISEPFMEGVPDADVDKIMSLYPNHPTQGSPFNTGDRNQLPPQFKRMAALLGDMVFAAATRFFPVPDRKSSLSMYFRFKNLEDLGATHTSDLVDPFSGGVTADYFIQFITSMDPNGHSTSNRTSLPWPKYSDEQPSLMTFFRDDATPVSIGQDDYRKDAIDEWSRVTLERASAH